MKNKFVLSVLTILLMLTSLANHQICQALANLADNSCLTNRRIALSVGEWGASDRLYAEPLFSNLVSVVNHEYGNCSNTFLSGMTNAVMREVLVGALAKCGQNIFRDAVVGWFGGGVPMDVPANVIDGFAMPANAIVGDYFILHYNEPGISNVWANLKSLYLTSSNVVEAARLDDIISGKTKAYLDAMKCFE